MYYLSQVWRKYQLLSIGVLHLVEVRWCLKLESSEGCSHKFGTLTDMDRTPEGWSGNSTQPPDMTSLDIHKMKSQGRWTYFTKLVSPEPNFRETQVKALQFLRTYPWKLQSNTSLLFVKIVTDKTKFKGMTTYTSQWRTNQVTTATVLDSKRRKISAMKIILLKSRSLPIF